MHDFECKVEQGNDGGSINSVRPYAPEPCKWGVDVKSVVMRYDRFADKSDPVEFGKEGYEPFQVSEELAGEANCIIWKRVSEDR